MFIAPLFLGQGDLDHDGRLSRDEFAALGKKWFAAWDTNKSDKLNLDKLRAGLNATMSPPGGFGGPGAGPGGRMPGMNLQGPEGKRNGLAAMLGTDFPTVRGDLDFQGQLFPEVAVRFKGNGTFMQSRPSLKRSLKVDLNDYVKGRRLGGASKLNLHNNVTDASWMNEVLSHRLFRDAGVSAPRTAYARLYLTVPGKHENQYLGLYSVVENVDNDFARDRFGTKKGALFKPVSQRLFEDLGDNWAAYRQTYDPKTPLSDEETRRLIAFCKLVSKASDAEFAARLGDYVDLDEFARFMAVTVWLSTLDSILGVGQNFLMYLHPKTRQFQFIPWDLDHSFGQFPLVGNQEQRENLSIHQPWNGPVRFLQRVFKVEQFKRLYQARLQEFSQSIFQPERLCRQVDELAAAIRPAIADESPDKLARFDKVVAGEPVGPAGFGDRFGGPRPGGEGPGGQRLQMPVPGPRPEGAGGDGPRFGPFGGFMQPIKPIKGFVTARHQSVVDQLAGKSSGAILARFGPDGPGGPGGPRGPGGPAGFGPGMFLGPVFMTALDTDKNGEITRAEFAEGFLRWFNSWNTNRSGLLTEEQLRAGLDQDLSPFRGRPPGGFGFGPPPGI
jgi:spore coat protein CotH